MNATNGNRWLVYMIRCDDDSLYTGITTDIARRWREHGGGDEEVSRSGKGAKFFRGRRPLQLVYLEGGHDRASATRRELTIKRLARAAKVQLLQEAINELFDWDRERLSEFGH